MSQKAADITRRTTWARQDAGGDADGQNFGQDQGSQDRMEADTVNIPMVGTVSMLTLGVVGIVGYWLWSRRE